MSIDLEKFPTSETAIRMLSRVSPVYDKSYFAKWIFQILGTELDFAKDRFEELNSQAFPETATWGLKYWEQRYGISVDETKDLEIRRRKIIELRGGRLPLNPARMEKRILDTFGIKAEIVEHVSPGVFHIYLYPSPGDTDYGAIIAFIRRIKQSHLSFELYTVVNENFNRDEYDYCTPAETFSEYFIGEDTIDYPRNEYYLGVSFEDITEYMVEDTEITYLQKEYVVSANMEQTHEYFNEDQSHEYQLITYDGSTTIEELREEFVDE